MLSPMRAMLSELSPYFPKDIDSLCSGFETPFYIFSQQQIVENVRSLVSAYQSEGLDSREFKIAYPLKANSLLEILNTFKSLKTWFEVCSLSELRRVYEFGNAPEQVIYSSLYKSFEAITYAIQMGAIIVLDSPLDISVVQSLADKIGKPVKVFLRINLDLDTLSAPFTSGTAQRKFGIPINEAEEVVRSIADSQSVILDGFQVHIASQILNPMLYSLASQALLNLVLRLRDSGIIIKCVDFGGGFPVQYDNQPVPDISRYVSAIVKPFQQAQLDVTYVVEPGRYCIANSCLLIVGVVGIKQINNLDRVAIVDTSFYSTLLDTMIYDWYFPIVKLERAQDSDSQLVEYCVSGCTSDSIDMLDRWLSQEDKSTNQRHSRQILKLEAGDRLVVGCAGAYTVPFNNNFCGLEVPQILIIDEHESVRVIKRKQEFEDIIQLEQFN